MIAVKSQKYPDPATLYKSPNLTSPQYIRALRMRKRDVISVAFEAPKGPQGDPQLLGMQATEDEVCIRSTR